MRGGVWGRWLTPWPQPPAVTAAGDCLMVTTADFWNGIGNVLKKPPSAEFLPHIAPAWYRSWSTDGLWR